MKKILFTLLFAGLMTVIYAGDFKVPKYEFKTAEDYALYEKDVIAAFDWLMATPLQDQKESNRKATEKFIVEWVMGSPNITITLRQNIVSFMTTSPKLLTIFFGGWTKYALENQDFNNEVAGNLAGLNAVIDYYTQNKKVLKADKNIDVLVKMRAKGKLQEFVEAALG